MCETHIHARHRASNRTPTNIDQILDARVTKQLTLNCKPVNSIIARNMCFANYFSLKFACLSHMKTTILLKSDSRHCLNSNLPAIIKCQSYFSVQNFK